VVDGVPVFVTGSDYQAVEHRLRDEVAADFRNQPAETMLRRLGRHHHVAVMEEAALAFAARIRAGCIVDIGAGWGWQWRRYTGHVPIVAVDFSLANCRLARASFLRDQPRVLTVCADARRLPLPAATGLWSVQTFQHFPPQVMDAVIGEAVRLAGPGGLEAEIVNLQPVWFVRAVHTLVGRGYLTRGSNGKFYLHRRRASELMQLFGPVARDLEVRYSELFFHPDLFIRWRRRYPSALERWLSARSAARWVARQIHVRFRIPAAGAASAAYA
jgi:hypothetical protein